jgi:hypothetical protein
MRRTLQCLTLIALAPFLLGAGGQNPPPPGSTLAGKVTFRANVLIDPHNTQGDVFGAGDPVPANATTTAKNASIQLRDSKKGTLLSQVEFRALPSFPLSFGCDPSLSDARFLYTPQNGALLAHWVPPAALQQLFAAQGVAVGAPEDPNNQPAIVQILRNECIADPRNPTTADGSAPDLLLLDVVIGIQVMP